MELSPSAGTRVAQPAEVARPDEGRLDLRQRLTICGNAEASSSHRIRLLIAPRNLGRLRYFCRAISATAGSRLDKNIKESAELR